MQLHLYVPVSMKIKHNHVIFWIVSLAWALLCNRRVIWCSSNDEVWGEWWQNMHCNNIWSHSLSDIFVNALLALRCPAVSEWNEVTPAMKNQFYVTVVHLKLFRASHLFTRQFSCVRFLPVWKSKKHANREQLKALEQGFPTFFLPCTPSASRQMSMYPYSISTDKDVPFRILTDERVPLKLLMTKYFLMIFHRYI